MSYSSVPDEYLLDLKMKGYSFSNDGLSEAIIKKNTEDIELFLKAGIDFNSVDKEGYTAIQRAEMTKDNDTLAFVSDLVRFSDRKKTFLALSTKNEQLKNDIVKNSDSLILYAKTNNIAGVKKSAENNKNPDEMSDEGLAPIHYAVFNDNSEILKILIDNGANVNIQSSEGLTPLDIAVLNMQEDIVKILAEKGGAMSGAVAEELIDLGCKTSYDENINLYKADYEDIYRAMMLLRVRLEN